MPEASEDIIVYRGQRGDKTTTISVSRIPPRDKYCHKINNNKLEVRSFRIVPIQRNKTGIAVA